MLIIRSSTRYVGYKRIPVSSLANPLTGNVEPMDLVLRQEETRIQTIGSVTYYSPKADGVFITADGKTIPPQQWTSPMELFFTQQKGLYPPPQKGRKFSTLAKLNMVAAVVFVLFTIGYIGKGMLIDRPKKEAIQAALAQPIQVGEQYNVSGYNSSTQKSGYYWVRVAQADTQAQTYKLCITGETSGDGFTVPEAVQKLADADGCLNTQKIERGHAQLDASSLQFRIGDTYEWLHVHTYAFDKVEQFKRAPKV